MVIKSQGWKYEYTGNRKNTSMQWFLIITLLIQGETKEISLPMERNECYALLEDHQTVKSLFSLVDVDIEARCYHIPKEMVNQYAGVKNEIRNQSNA